MTHTNLGIRQRQFLFHTHSLLSTNIRSLQQTLSVSRAPYTALPLSCSLSHTQQLAAKLSGNALARTSPSSPQKLSLARAGALSLSLCLSLSRSLPGFARSFSFSLAHALSLSVALSLSLSLSLSFSHPLYIALSFSLSLSLSLTHSLTHTNQGMHYRQFLFHHHKLRACLFASTHCPVSVCPVGVCQRRERERETYVSSCLLTAQLVCAQ